MSTPSILAVTVVYLLPVALIALLLTAERRRPRWLLIAALLVLPCFYVGHYLALLAIQGWPSGSPIPQQFRLLAFDITEPDPNNDRDGRILLWITAADSDQPRAHRLAYDKDLHRELIAAGQRQAQGRPQSGTRSRQASAAASASTGGTKETITFRDTTGRSLPPKQ